MNRILIQLCLVFLAFFDVLSTLTVSLDNYTVDTPSTYTWDMTFTGTKSRTSIVLHFHDTVQVSFTQITSVMMTVSGTSTDVTNSYSVANNQMTITVPIAYINSLSFMIIVSKVVNSYRQISINPYVTTNAGDNQSAGSITFVASTIQICQVGFLGNTWDTSGTFYLNFTAKSRIPAGTVKFEVSFPVAYQLSRGILVKDGVSTCSFKKLTDTNYANAVYPTTDTGQFICTFTTTAIAAQQNIVLRLSNVVLPPFVSGYGSFGLNVYDTNYIIEGISSCSNTPVNIATYTGTFDSIVEINKLYQKSIISSYLTPIVTLNDVVTLTYTGVTISGCVVGNSLTFKRGIAADSSFSITSLNNTSGIMAMKVVIGNNKVGLSNLSMNNCSFNMPPSQTPVPLIFNFKYNSNSYMEIHCNLQASAKALTSSQFSLQILDYQIGNNITYTFTVTTTSLLGNNPSFLIDFPSEVGFEAFIQNECEITEYTNLEILSIACSVANAVSKIINVTILGNVDIQAQKLLIAIHNLSNPPIPKSYNGFGIETYYSKLVTSSVVERGSSLFSKTYEKRQTQISLASSQTYTVNSFPSYFTTQYFNKVALPLGGIIQIQFLTSLVFAEVYFSSATIDGSSYTFVVNKNSNNTFTFRHTATIPKYSKIHFQFKFRAPGKVGDYEIIKLRSYSIEGSVYEYTPNPLILTIHTAAQQSFSVSPTLAKTGALTSYIFSFYTSITHVTPFTFQIVLPADVVAPSGYTYPCTGSSTTPATTKIESGKTVLVVTISSSTNNRYYLTVGNLKNPREIGATGLFYFRTYQAGSQILGGSSSAYITLPNYLDAELDPDLQYFRNNDASIQILFTPTNSLYIGDYLYLTFDYRTYSQNGVISCSLASCIALVTSSSVTLIKVTLTSSVSAGATSKFWINGLISYGSTVSIPMTISIESYSYTGNSIDSGQIDYILTCSVPTVADKLCKKCDLVKKVCTECYYDEGFNLYKNTSCTNNCGNTSSYETYPGSQVCVSCYTSANNCKTCITADKCLTCTTGYFLYEDQTCKSYCPTTLYYKITLGVQRCCLPCFSQFCEICANGSSNGCTSCIAGYFWDAGYCSGSCGFGSYSNGSACLACDNSCYGCDGAGNSGCLECFVGYYNISGKCLSGCPTGSVVMEDTCGCDIPCSTCKSNPTFCLTCLDTELVVYNGQCLETCPNSTFFKDNECTDCNAGCLECTPTTCLQCLSGYNSYENKCYTQCNDIGDRYAGSEGRCIECPLGCDVCNATYHCSICLSNYTLTETSCTLTCEIEGDCEPENPVPDQIIPLPGFITAAIWLGLIVILKIFIVKGMYVPYSFVYVGCVIEFVLMLVVFIYEKNTIQSIIDQIQTARLLQTSKLDELIVEDYQYGVVGLLATTIAFNYISNIVYIVFFCKYLKKHIADRQVDLITNYLVLILGSLSNYRFSLLAYSKMFPKPKIQVENSSNLTPLHYLCISSIFLSIFPLVASCILIYNQYPLTDLFMLGIDLLIILIINILFSIWMVSTEKSEDYFETTKKYSIQEHYKTEQNLHDKDTKNMSKTNLVGNSYQNNSIVNAVDYDEEIQDIDFEKSMIKNERGQKIKPMASSKKNKIENSENDSKGREGSQSGYNKEIEKSENKNESKFNMKDRDPFDKSDNENDPLPNIPVRSSNINFNTLKGQNSIEQYQDDDADRSIPGKKVENSAITKRKQMNRKFKKIEEENGQQAQQPKKEGGIKSKVRESTRNFSKEKNPSPKRPTKENEKTKRSKQIQSEQNQEGEIPISQPGLVGKSKSGTTKKQKKPMKTYTQRSETQFQKEPNMRKKDSYGIFESDQADSVVDEIDLDTIIQSKMIDKTKKAGKGRGTATKTEKGQDDRADYEDVSPSWFNVPNQRYDLEDQNSEY